MLHMRLIIVLILGGGRYGRVLRILILEDKIGKMKMKVNNSLSPSLLPSLSLSLSPAPSPSPLFLFVYLNDVRCDITAGIAPPPSLDCYLYPTFRLAGDGCVLVQQS